MFCHVKTYYAQYKAKQLVSSRELGSGLKQHPRQEISLIFHCGTVSYQQFNFGWLWEKKSQRRPQPSIEMVSDLVIKTALWGKEKMNNKENKRSNKCGWRPALFVFPALGPTDVSFGVTYPLAIRSPHSVLIWPLAESQTGAWFH